MRRISWRTGAICLFSCLMLGLTWRAAQAAPPAVSWNFHTVLGHGDPALEEGERWALNEMSKTTGGNFKAVVYEKSSLGFAGPDIWDVVSKGLVPIAEMWGPHVAGRYPWITALELPFVYDVTDLDLTDRLVDELWDYYAKPLEEDNLVLLGLTMLPAGRSFATNKPLNKDPHAPFKGLKFRVSGPIPSWACETLGGTPVMMDFAEVYEAAQRGIVDGIDPGLSKSFLMMKFNEVVKTAVLLDRKTDSPFQVGSTTWMVVANKDKFEKLPKAWQDTLRSLFRVAGRRLIRPYLSSLKESVEEGLTKDGMKYETVKPETLQYLHEKAPEFWKAWREKAGTHGNELLDKAVKLIQAYK